MKTFLVVIGLFAFLALAIAQNCSSTQFECDNGDCIPAAYVCDRYHGCKIDGSDEPPQINPEDCPKCTTGKWRCKSGLCINKNYICDSHNDCGDWSDESEEECPCSDQQIRCNVGPCIPDEYMCDLIWDCPDGSDEINCTRSSLDKTVRNADTVQLHNEKTKNRPSLNKMARNAGKRF